MAHASNGTSPGGSAAQGPARAFDRFLALLRATWQATTNAILVTDNDGRLVDFNEKFLVMWDASAELMRGFGLMELRSHVASHMAAPDAHCRRVFDIHASREAPSFDLLQLLDGRFIERHSSPQVVDGVVVGRVWTFADVTEARKLEGVLRVTNEAVDQLRGENIRLASERERELCQLKESHALQQDYLSALQNVSRRLMHAEAAQGRRLGRELHDRVGSNISAMLLTVALVRKEMDTAPAAGPSSRLGALEEMLNTTMQHVRDLLSDLRPTGLDELGLVAALRHHAALLSARSEVEFIVSGREFSPRLDPDCEMAFFRIAQEAWTNALKHAHATRVVLTLTSTRRRVLMQVQDDGRGFLPAAGKIPTLGLTTMRERAQAIGATLNVAHSTGAGVRLDLILPRPATGAG